MAEEEKVEVQPAEEEEEEVAASDEEAKPGFFTAIKAKLGKILLYLLGAIIVILISVGASYYVSSHVNKKKIKEIGGKIHIPPPPPYNTLNMGEFTINIPGDDEEPHFIRVSIVLAYPERKLELQSELGKRRDQIQDKINMIISRKTKKELDKAEGKENLKIELKEQINQLLQSGKIMEVYFKNITVM